MEKIKAQLNFNHLRYGNFVEVNNEIQRPIAGFKLSSKSKLLKIENKDIPLENCSPILLNSDWLIGFGFKKIGSNYIKETFSIDENFVYHYKDRTSFIPFVHDLQNLYFKKTDEELTLSNDELPEFFTKHFMKDIKTSIEV